MTHRLKPIFEVAVILVALLVLGGIAFAIWQVTSGRSEVQLFALLGNALLTGKVLKMVAAALVVVTAVALGVWNLLRRRPDTESDGAEQADLGLGPARIPEQIDLGPVMDNFVVDLEKKRE